MKNFKGGTAVITGAGSGFGLETSRMAARLGMNVVMADVQQDALDKAAAEIASTGAQVLALRTDVSQESDVQALGAAAFERFGAPNFVFNNAGVSSRGGLLWEQTAKDWEWTFNVNVMGVVNGVRVFTPMMIKAARANRAYEGHIVNTSSMAGLLAAPLMGSYTASKHAVVALSETLFQELKIVTDQIGTSVLCPYYVPTGISDSQRNRPEDLKNNTPATASQLVAEAVLDKAVSSGKVSAQVVVQFVFDAVRENRFYIYSHPQALAAVQNRMEDILQTRNPSDPFLHKPEAGEQLRAAMRAALD